jgi:hypothetical protein
VNAAVMINQTSGNTEWYTPAWVVDAARMTMGGIDLDPASSAAANERIRATHIYTASDDGLLHDWAGRVWMNHPFGREGNPLWVAKLMREYESGRVSQACCICFACTSEQWFQPLYNFPICFFRGRVNYLLPDGTPKPGVTKGSCLAYLGTNVPRFIEMFSSFGAVMLPADGAQVSA